MTDETFDGEEIKLAKEVAAAEGSGVRMQESWDTQRDMAARNAPSAAETVETANSRLWHGVSLLEGHSPQ